MAYLRLLVIGLTVLGFVIDALKIRRPLSFPRLETWRKLEEAADMTDLFVGLWVGVWMAERGQRQHYLRNTLS